MHLEVHASVYLEVHERMDTVLLGESIHGAIPMRFNSIGEIACYAYVEGSVGSAGKDVDHRLLHPASNASTAARVDYENGLTGSPPSRGRRISASSESP